MDNIPSSSFTPLTKVEDKFICSSCDASFSHAWSLIRHDRTIHWKNIFSCTCLRSFGRKDHLIRHRKICNGEVRLGTVVNVQAGALATPLPPLTSMATTKDLKFKKGSSPNQKTKSGKKIVAWTPYSKAATRNFPNPGQFRVCPITDRLIIPGVVPAAAEGRRATTPPSTSHRMSTPTLDDPASPLTNTLVNSANARMHQELFGDASSDEDETPKAHSSAHSASNSHNLEIDLHLSSSDSSLDLTDDENPSPEGSCQETPPSHKMDKKILDNILAVLADLSLLQDLTVTHTDSQMCGVADILDDFHLILQDRINKLSTSN